MELKSRRRAAEPPCWSDGIDWLRTLRRYMAFFTCANLLWEFAHMPFYTIWETGTLSEIAFAAFHCTGGDILIGLTAIVLALFVAGTPTWPHCGYRRVATITFAAGLAYTIFSEWLNVDIRAAWSYRDIMPVVPVVGTGLTPIVQWILVPVAAFWWARRSMMRPNPQIPADG